MNYNYPTTILRSISPIMYKFLVEKYKLQFLLVKFSRSKWKIVNTTRNTLYLGQTTSKTRSQIIVVYVHENVFL